VANVGRLEKKLDPINIGNMKLNVNLPRYRRAEFGSNMEERKKHGKGIKERKYKEVCKEKKKKGKHSFVDVVIGSSQD